MGKTATATARVVASASAKTPLKVVKPTVEKSKAPATITLRSQVVMCTPSVAKQLRAACHFERQRALSDDHIARLAEEMTRGSFVAGTQIFMGVLPSREMLILNGNHTLEAVAFSGVPTALTFTYCPKGHEYTPENTGLHPGKKRFCRTCSRAKCRTYYQENKQRLVTYARDRRELKRARYAE